jgi:hypothetical protein
MTTVEIHTVDDGGEAIERRVHAPPTLSLEVRERLVLAGAEAMLIEAEHILPLVRAALMAKEREALEWAEIIEQNLVAEREA